MFERQYRILLIEDNQGDIRLAKEAFKEIEGLDINFVIAEDGETALDLIKKTPKPDIVILDLNIPKIHGRDVLKKFKNSEEYRAIPIMVLTTSKAQSDINYCYNNHANAYVLKPIDFDEFCQKIENFAKFWFQTVELL